ncbi:hypothetical protein LDENG_00231170 [Lucifuga dentata]|nr:hypothetical protein LDENG_00231170 [Lucifuga dentata]
MASHNSLLRHTNTRVESPAKVFAKLKSKVQREAVFAKRGMLTENNTQREVGDKQRADFYKSRQKKESTWMIDDIKESQMVGFCPDEAEVLTLSPIPSPRKSLGYTYTDLSNTSPEKLPNVTDIRNKNTPSKRSVMQPLAVSQPHSKQIHRAPPPVGDLDIFRIINSTTPKRQPTEDVYGRSVFEDPRVSLDKLMSPAKMFSTMKERLKKRKLEQQDIQSNNTINELDNETIRQPKERKMSSVFNEDIDTTVENLVDVGRTSFPAEVNQSSHELIFTPGNPVSKKWCDVTLTRLPLMSPAKMFSHMKERENKKQQQEVQKVSSSIRKLNTEDHGCQPRVTAFEKGETEDSISDSVAESATPVNQSRLEATDSQSDIDPSGDILIPAAPSQPVLHEDPLVLDSPYVSIPKKREAVFKNSRWPKHTMLPSENVIYLRKWFLRNSRKGLYVEGIHREEGIPWNSNVIEGRVSNSVLKTVSGRIYVLAGKMNMNIQSELPKWFLRKFLHGFPSNWKMLYEKFLSDSKDKGPESNGEGWCSRSRMVSEMPESSRSTKQHREKRLKTPASCPPATFSSLKVSRSGRIIKPPLDFWRGGRVILDANMNVTIHECYDTSICNPEVTTTVTTRVSQKAASKFLPCGGEHAAPLVPLRKVKPPHRKNNRANAIPDKKPSGPNERPKEVLTQDSSPEELSDRITRSRLKHPLTERSLDADNVPQSQSQPEQRSKKQMHSVRVLGMKQTVCAPTKSRTVCDKTPSDDDVFIKRKRKCAHRKRGKNEARPSQKSPEDSGREMRKKATISQKNNAAQTQRQHKSSKHTKTSPPPKPSPELGPPGKKHKENNILSRKMQGKDEDEWTEAELRKLQEAVSSYPKHMRDYWANVAMMVGTRSGEECYKQHTSQGAFQTPNKKAKKPKKAARKAPAPDPPVISARAGTLKRKQQVRQFLEAMPKENVDDVFSTAYMQSKRFELPSMCPSDDYDFTLSDQELLTPKSAGFLEVKTPQCLHITPRMMGSPNRTNDDKYIYQLQKRMNKSQFNVCKQELHTLPISETSNEKMW